VVETTAVTSRSWSARLAPALVVLLLGWSILFLRGPLPLDETRYAEVFREMLSGSKLVLTLNGEGYSHKTPLLFWFAWAAHSLGFSLGASLMVWPAIFSSATVLLIGRIGDKLGLRHVDWLVAGMVMPLIFSGVVLFDAMLAVFVWLFLWARFEGRDLLAMAASVPMMMAKGPAALVFALPFGWVLSSKREGRRAWTSNLLAQLIPGFVVLGGWAYVAILKAGGSSAEGGDFAANLAWNQTAGRVVNSFAHARSPFWYVPIIIVAALPYSGQLLTPLRRLRKTAMSAPILRQLVIASLVIFVVWSLISGKQPHYLLPMLPALALLFAADFEARPALIRRSSVIAGSFLVLLAAILLVIRFAWFSDPLDGYGDRAAALRASAFWNGLLFSGLGVASIAAAVLFRAKLRIPAMAATFGLGLYALLFPIHSGFARLAVFENIVREPHLSTIKGRPLATVGNKQAGMYNLIFETNHVDSLSADTEDAAKAILSWCEAHPTGALFIEEKNLAVLEGLPLEALVRDRFRGKLDWAMLVKPGAALDLKFMQESFAK